MIHGDALYYNEGMFFGLHRPAEVDALKFLVLLSAYDQSDLLAHMLGAPHAALANIPAEQRRRLVRGLTRTQSRLAALARRLLPGIPHVRLRKLVDALQDPRSDSWHDPDFF